jgi:hypothetical protein
MFKRVFVTPLPSSNSSYPNTPGYIVPKIYNAGVAWWLMSVILATQEVEMERIAVWGQQKCETHRSQTMHGYIWCVSVISTTWGSTNRRTEVQAARHKARPYLKINSTKRTGGVTQVVEYLPQEAWSPEFKLQYCPKINKVKYIHAY